MSSWCQECGSQEMTTGADGSFYCQSCGAQNRNYLEEAFDVDEGHMFNTRYVRETRAAATQIESQIATAATQRSDVPAEIFAGSQALFSQPLSQDNYDLSLTPYGVESGTTPSQTGRMRGSDLTDKRQIILKEELSDDIRKSYVEGVQKILLLQCETLVKEFSVTPLICGIIGPLWLRYVASTRVFEQAWADEALEVAEVRERSRKNPRRKVFKASQRLWEIQKKSLLFPVELSLGQREGKLPFLTAHIELSKPSGNHIPNTIGGSQRFPLDAKLMFQPKNVIGARAVELLAGHIAERIGLQLPPVNYHALSCRLLHALKLPVETLSVYTRRIYEWYCPAGLWLTSKESALPTRVYIMAMIIIVLKVLYRLDGRVEGQTPESETALNGKGSLDNDETEKADKEATEDMQVDHQEPDNPDDDVTSQKHKINMDDQAPGAPDRNTEKVQQLDDLWDVRKLVMHMKKMKPFRRKRTTVSEDERKLAAYLRYCHDVIYAGVVSGQDEDMRNEFWKAYETKANEASGSKLKDVKMDDFEDDGNSGAEPQHPVDNVLTADARIDEIVRNSTRRHGSVGSVAGVQTRRHTDRRPIRDDGRARELETEINERGVFEGGKDNAVDADVKVDLKGFDVEDFDRAKEDARDAEERELQLLMKDMKKLGFSCLQPLTMNEVSDDYYVKYKYQISDRKLRPVHMEYFIVLRVCAKLIKVHPKALHWGVQKVEQGLMEMEKNTREFMLRQGGDIAKHYKDNIGVRTEYRGLRDRHDEFQRKKRKLMQARFRVDEGFATEKDYIDVILNADYL
ncbi:hypothetical protein R1sor_004746 [Riccia sorocarpa]|uniref:Rrn7/TAF1B C-terminal cyclin domain-containing protein n=1 Tax=Riccia sorocarpa TaxID=122646 RepID=A0ABD3HHJ8_9MARC